MGPITARMEIMTSCEFEAKERWLKTFPRITVSMVLCQFFYIKNQSHEKETQQKKVLKEKINVRINFPFFKQTSHYNVYGSEGNATTAGSFPMVDLVYYA